jgi:hypothetical protein
VYINAISDVMVTVLASGEVDHRLELWSRSVYINAISGVMVTVLTDGINIHRSRLQL